MRWYLLPVFLAAIISLLLLPPHAMAADPWEGFIPTSINGTAPYTVTLVSISYNDPTAWNWSFTNVAGNNTEVWFSQTENTTITFYYGGNYSIRLNSSNADGYNITPFLVFVNVTGDPSALTADFTATAAPGTKTVTFTDLSTATPASWAWAYKEQTGIWTAFSTIQNPTNTFTNGRYDINLTVTYPGGTDSEIKLAYIIVTDSGTFTPESTSTANPSQAGNYIILALNLIGLGFIIGGALILVSMFMRKGAIGRDGSPGTDLTGTIVTGIFAILVGAIFLLVTYTILGPLFTVAGV
jgi:hypothetical protein